MQFLPITRSNEIVVQELGVEVLIYDLKTDKVCSLNEVSAAIWRACDGKSDVKEITRRLNLKANQQITEELVRLALFQFKKENLLENGLEMEQEFAGVSRRELIRRAGLASSALLPLISTVIAPTGIMSASGCMNPGGAAPNAFAMGFCGPIVGGPPATIEQCTIACTNGFGSNCASCQAYAVPGAMDGFYTCYCV